MEPPADMAQARQRTPTTTLSQTSDNSTTWITFQKVKAPLFPSHTTSTRGAPTLSTMTRSRTTSSEISMDAARQWRHRDWAPSTWKTPLASAKWHLAAKGCKWSRIRASGGTIRKMWMECWIAAMTIGITWVARAKTIARVFFEAQEVFRV